MLAPHSAEHAQLNVVGLPVQQGANLLVLLDGEGDQGKGFSVSGHDLILGGRGIGVYGPVPEWNTQVAVAGFRPATSGRGGSLRQDEGRGDRRRRSAIPV